MSDRTPPGNVVEAAAEVIRGTLALLLPEQRTDVLCLVGKAICLDCGCDQTGGQPCQCWNDE